MIAREKQRPDGYIKSQQEWSNFWGRFQNDGTMPKVDFEREWVYIHTRDSNDRNSQSISFFETSVAKQSTLIGFPQSDVLKVEVYLVTHNNTREQYKPRQNNLEPATPNSKSLRTLSLIHI